MTGTLRLKSLFDAAAPEDGTRILVARYAPYSKTPWWDEWNDPLAPSISLLRQGKSQMRWSPQAAWYSYSPAYMQEMQSPAPQAAIQAIRARLHAGETITLLCYCSDERYCHRSRLRDLILEVTTP